VIKTVTDHVVAALLEAFPGAEVFTEQVRQGLVEPCFVVRCARRTSERFLGNRHWRTHLFSVTYFPESRTDAKEECGEVAERLFRALELVGGEQDPTRGTRMAAELADGALVFTASYNFHVRETTESDPMETLSVENEAR
jgi:hypothetical protein